MKYRLCGSNRVMTATLPEKKAESGRFESGHLVGDWSGERVTMSSTRQTKLSLNQLITW